MADLSAAEPGVTDLEYRRIENHNAIRCGLFARGELVLRSVLALHMRLVVVLCAIQVVAQCQMIGREQLYEIGKIRRSRSRIVASPLSVLQVPDDPIHHLLALSWHRRLLQLIDLGGQQVPVGLDGQGAVSPPIHISVENGVPRAVLGPAPGAVI